MPLNTEYRIAFRLSRDSTRNSWIVRNYRCTAGGPEDSPQNFGDSFGAQVLLELAPLWCPNVVCNLLEVAYSTAPTITIYSADPEMTGEHAGSENLPDQVAALIRLPTSMIDTRHVAKVFVPYVPVVDNQIDVDAYFNELETAATLLQTPFFSSTTPLASWSPVKWTRASGTSQLINDGLADPGYWTQRRRIPRGDNPLAMYPMTP